MIRIHFSLLLFVISFLLASCGQASNTDLEKKLEVTNAKIASLEKDLAQQKRSASINEFIANLDKIAYLTPGSDGYIPVKFDLGYITVQLANIRPYANGSKVTLKFGNILSASINGLKIDIDWGKVDAKGMMIQESTKTKEFTFVQVLRPAAWTSVTVILEGIPPKDLGFVRVRNITHTGMRLFK